MKKSKNSKANQPTHKMLKQISLTPVQVKMLDYEMDFGAKKMQVRYGLN